jgi:hypothetical protein
MSPDLPQLLGNPDALRQRVLDLQREARFVQKLLNVTLQVRGEKPITHRNRRDVCSSKT